MRRKLSGLAITVFALLTAGQGSSPAADTISAPERCDPKYGCSFSAPSYSMYPGETPIIAMPSVLDFPHDVTSTDRSLDNRALFRSAQVGAGKSALVEGAEYLPPGVYHFICSIHKYPTIYGTRMEADLVVLDNGLPPKPRPTIEMEFPNQRLRQVLERGALTVAARAETATGQVSLIARMGKRVLATKQGLTLSPGAFQHFELRLSRGARRRLGESHSARVSVVGAARFGEPVSLRRRLH